MIRCSLGFFAVLALSGCYSSAHVTPAGEPGTMSQAQFNERFSSEEATIVLRRGQAVEGTALSVGHDTLFWTDPQAQRRVNTRIDSVRYVYTSERLIPALVGLGIGAGVGVVVAAIGAGGDHHDGDMKGFFWVIGPPAGAVLGAGIGAIVGRTRSYDFTPGTRIDLPGEGK